MDNFASISSQLYILYDLDENNFDKNKESIQPQTPLKVVNYNLLPKVTTHNYPSRDLEWALEML